MRCMSWPGCCGTRTPELPRLAGQHVQYLMKQLRSFQNNMRNVAVMHGVAQGLKVHDMLAVPRICSRLINRAPGPIACTTELAHIFAP